MLLKKYLKMWHPTCLEIPSNKRWRTIWKLLNRHPLSHMYISLFRGATPHSPGEVAAAGAEARRSKRQGNNELNNCNTLFQNSIKRIKAYECVNNTQSRYLGSTIRKAKVIELSRLTLQAECTQRQRVSENTLQLLDQTYNPINRCQRSHHYTFQRVFRYQRVQVSDMPIKAICSVAEPTQYSVMALPILHLSLALEDPPWIQLTQRGILPMAETICRQCSYSRTWGLLSTAKNLF